MQDNFIGGYTKALVDVRNFIEDHSWDLKRHRLFNYRGIMEVVKALIDHREDLRETGDCTLTWVESERRFLRRDEESRGGR